MHQYSIYSPCAFVIYRGTAEKMLCHADPKLKDEISSYGEATLLSILYNNFLQDDMWAFSMAFNFVGSVLPYGYDNYRVELDDDIGHRDLLFVDLVKDIELTKAAYESEESMITEFKTRLCKYLPKDFNVASCLYTISGVCD